MKTKIFSSLALMLVFVTPAVLAQNAPADDADSANETATANATTTANDTTENATTANDTATAATPAPAPNQTIYVPRLPSAQELSDAAGTQQGVAIDRIEQTDSKVTVVYKFSNGQTNTVAYQVLPTANAVPANGAPATAGQTTTRVVTTTPPPTIVYRTAPRVVYYDDPYYPYSYYPGYYWPPVSLSLGLGYVWHGGHHYHGHGGWHHGGGHRGGWHGGHHR
jgi:hypothetical protein